MGEGVGGGAGVGRRAMFVCFGVWNLLEGEKRGGSFRFSIFFEGGSVAGQVFVLVCVKKEAALLVCVLFGGDSVRQGCLASLVSCETYYDVCVRCGGMRGQGVGGVGTYVRRRGRVEEKGPIVCVPAP